MEAADHPNRPGSATGNRVPAPEPSQEPLDDAEPDFDMTGRCEWCLTPLPSDMLCRCPGSLEDLRAERARLPHEEER